MLPLFYLYPLEEYDYIEGLLNLKDSVKGNELRRKYFYNSKSFEVLSGQSAIRESFSSFN